MNQQQVHRNIILYYWLQLLAEPLFWGPILITYIQNVGRMSLGQIYFMEACCVMGVVLLDVPAGALADLIGRRRTIFWSRLLITLECLLFAAANNQLTVWLANLIWVIAYSLMSNADSSLLIDTLKVAGREKEFKNIIGKANSYRLALMAICSPLVGYLANLNLRLPAYLSVIFIAANCLVASRLIDPPVVEHYQKTWSGYYQLFKTSFGFVKNHRELKWIIIFSILISVISKIWFFTYNPYFTLVDLPLKTFGWIFLALNATAALSSYSSEWLYQKLGEFYSAVLMVLVVSLPIIAMGIFVSQAAALLVLLQNVARGYMTPLTNHMLHRYLNANNRATVASFKSSAVSLGEVLSMWLFAYWLKIFSLTACLQLLGITGLTFGLIILFSYQPIFKH
ncbi:MAG: MFS transporter [Candidatus Buchananbacteria bacterium]